MDQHLQGAAPHARGDFTAQQARRGTRQEQLHALGVHQPSGKGLPPRDQLNLVEEKRGCPRIANARLQTEVLLDQPRQVGGLEAHQTVVFKAEEEKRLARRTRPEAIRQTLPQKRGLAASPYSNDRQGLAGHRRQTQVPARHRRGQAGKSIRQLLSEHFAHICPFCEDIMPPNRPSGKDNSRAPSCRSTPSGPASRWRPHLATGMRGRSPLQSEAHAAKDLREGVFDARPLGEHRRALGCPEVAVQ